MEIISLDLLKKEIQDHPRPTVLRFHRPGCPACEQSHAAWKELSNRQDMRHFKFYSINTQVYSDFANKANITAVPTFVIVSRSVPDAKIVGANMSRLEQILKSL